MEVQVHECRWSAAQRQVQMERWALAAAPNHTAFTSFIADLAAAEAPSRISDLHRPSLDFWPFVDVGRREEGRGGEGMRRVGKGGPRSKKAGGEVSEAKGAAAVTSESGPSWRRGKKERGCLVEARPRRRTDGRRPELERGHSATDWGSHWQQTPGQTDQSEGSAGLRGWWVGGGDIMRGLDMQRSPFRGESNTGAQRPQQHIARASSLLRPSLFQHFNIAAN